MLTLKYHGNEISIPNVKYVNMKINEHGYEHKNFTILFTKQHFFLVFKENCMHLNADVCIYFKKNKILCETFLKRNYPLEKRWGIEYFLTSIE